MRVQYKDEKGMIQIREVPDDADPKTYKWGVLVGPPDLSDLALSGVKIKELTKALAEANFGNYNDTKGKRKEISDILFRVTGKRDKELLRHVLYLYQKELLD